MCGRFTLHEPADSLGEYFEALFQPSIIPFFPSYTPRYNIAPTQTVLTIRAQAHDSGVEAASMRWGLVPGWFKSLDGPPLINARAETVAEKPSFRTAFRRRRCLIPANGFFEWQVISPKLKRPHYIRLRSGQPMALAGLWETWQPLNAPPVESCTILTTQANSVMKPLHDRMPVILAPEEFASWLDPGMANPDVLSAMLRQFPAEEMVAFEVSSLVGSVRNHGPDLILPVN